MGMKQNLEKNMNKVASWIQENQYMQSISGGLMSLMPIMMVGAMASLVDGMPLGSYQSFLTGIGLKPYLNILINLTTNFIAVYAAFSISSKFASENKKDGFTAGILSLMSFLIVTPLGFLEDSSAYIPLEWLGGKGLFVAMIIGLLSSKLYVYILDKGLYIKMPEGVPPTLEKSFAAIIPGLLIAPLMLVISAAFNLTTFVSIHGFIFGIIQAPLTSVGGSPITFILMILFCHVLWAFGIHGMSIFFAVMFPLLTPLGIANLDAFRAGQDLPNILTFDSIGYALIGGSGATLGLVIAMAFRAKSKQFKTIGKLGIIPSLFGINEPILYGTPVVLNPYFAIPLILAPTVTFLIGYLLTLFGILPRLNGIGAPLGTPIIVQGLIIGGWKVALYQVVATGISYLIYLPFFKKADEASFSEEIHEPKSV